MSYQRMLFADNLPGSCNESILSFLPTRIHQEVWNYTRELMLFEVPTVLLAVAMSTYEASSLL